MHGADRDAARLADEQAALRRVSELVARGPLQSEVLDAIAAEACTLFEAAFTSLLRFEDDGSATILALHNAPPELAVGDRWLASGDGIVSRMLRSGRAVRVNTYDSLVGPDADRARRLGVKAAVGAPIRVEGRLWAVVAAMTSSQAVAPSLEPRLAEFAELAVTAIAAAQTTADLRDLAHEQAALRRVAEIVAAGASQPRVFDAVADEACRLLGGHFTALLRYEHDGPAVIVAMHGANAVKHVMHVGMRLADNGDGLVQRVQRSAQAARIDSYSKVPGWNAATARDLALTTGVGAPIITEGQVWGAITVLGSGPPLPTDAEARLEKFAKLVATAISNAQARSSLGALADEQAAMRRVAELVARGASQERLVNTVVVEASRLSDDEAATLIRIDDDATCSIVAACGGPAAVGTRIQVAPEDGGLLRQILRTGSPARVDDYQATAGPARARDDYGVGSGVGVPVIVGDEVWGILAVTTAGRHLPATAERRLGQFSELVAAALANARARAEVQQLADEQTALRHVAELVARGVAPRELFAAVATEASALLGGQAMTLTQFEGDRGLVVVAAAGGPAPVGTHITFEAETLPERVRREDRVVRVDDYTRERDAQLAVQFGLAASVAAPISVEGEVWGMLTATSEAQPLPAGVEHRLQQFATLVAAALANSQARADVQALADEQAALRHVAELVARGASLEEVFAAVATEASKLIGQTATALLRYDADDTAVAVAVCNSPAPLGLRIPSDGDTATGKVLRTGRPIRVDSFAGTTLADLANELGVGGGVGVPVTVEGRVWGSLSASTPGSALPIGIEGRLAQFAELAAAAIANAENKSKLTASRARIVATADETRRRLQRDLHDGAQQRLVHTLITLGRARDAAAEGRSAAALIDEALDHAQRASSELRDLVRGILPASLTRGGLRAGVESLVRDIPISIDTLVTTRRLPAHTETTAYFIVAEALTNVVKHAHATHATVEVQIEGTTLMIHVRDDGSGGAGPSQGTGLTGLLDRIEASNGTLTITSPLQIGTTLHATLPLGDLDAEPMPNRENTISG